MSLCGYVNYICTSLVPTANTVSVTAVNAQIVGQPLTLECNVTTVRGITSRVDIVWSINGLELERIEGANISFISDNFVMYIHSYDILQLNTSNEGEVYQCEVVVNTRLLVVANDNITLKLIG